MPFYLLVYSKMSVPDYDYIFKLLIVGPPGAGKSSFLIRYADGNFTDAYLSTIGVDFKLKNIISPESGKKLKLQIWDTSGGRERFRAISTSYYRGAMGVFVLFDVTDREQSFKGTKYYFEQIEQHSKEHCQKVLVGTKTDLVDKRQVSYEEAKEFADHLGIPYIETSAKNDININEAVQMLSRAVEANYEKIMPPTNPHPQIPTQTQSRGCIIL